VRPLALALSLCSPIGAARSAAQEQSEIQPEVLISVVSTPPEPGLEQLSIPHLNHSISQSPTTHPDYLRFSKALKEHEEIFGIDSSVLLVWPDHFLSYEPLAGATLFDDSRLMEFLTARGREVLLDGSYMLLKYDEAISTVRATTNLVGPAAFPLSERQPEVPTLIAVVGYDSARPRTLALKSLAGMSCPTAMLSRFISRDDLRAFVQLHESGHALQFISGRHEDSEHESHYARCITEAEADVFATLWWLKTREGDTTVPNYFYHLRCSSYFEHAARGAERVSLQYATHIPLLSALDQGERLFRNGALSAMQPEGIYELSRQIVRRTLLQERETLELTRAVHRALGDAWQLPFHARIERLNQMMRQAEVDTALQPAVQSYLSSVTFLTDPVHLHAEYPDLTHLPLGQLAERVWLRELRGDLNYAVAPTLVLERYSTELSGAALGVWRLSASSPEPDKLTRFIVHDGAVDAFFVPTEHRSKHLDAAKEELTERLRAVR
jgi:hypothetical protein